MIVVRTTTCPNHQRTCLRYHVLGVLGSQYPVGYPRIYLHHLFFRHPALQTCITCFPDILRSKRTLGWRTLLVVPELEEEMVIAERTQMLGAEVDSLFEQRARLDGALSDLSLQVFAFSTQTPISPRCRTPFSPHLRVQFFF